MSINFADVINDQYACKGGYVVLGGAKYKGESVTDTLVKIPLKTLNRHGLIAGATGTGKTKTLQGFAESLSREGVSCLLMDVKGDLSGLAVPGEPSPRVEERHKAIGTEWIAEGYPVEFLTISEQNGCRLRATVSEFGPVLFSKILELNDTQSGVVSLIFKYCDDKLIPVIDLKDFKKTLQYLTNEGKEEIEKDYGRINSSSASTILRKIIEIEQQGADRFFGERSFDPIDLVRLDERGYGYLNIIRLNDIQDKPKLFSTFMLSLLAEIYATFPEEGDSDKPKLAIFIDEAHLIFDEASKALLQQIETIIKLIRSKGVGVFFCTQQPTDVPEAVLSQLGLKVQHALRAFTAKDRKMIKTVSENYPLSDFYDIPELLTGLGIGEALVTGLNEKGIPTPVVHTLLCAPHSRMDVLTDKELNDVINRSKIAAKYNEELDRESAFEILSDKLARIANEEPVVEHEKKKPSKKTKTGGVEDIINSTTGRQLLNTVVREISRGLLGAFGISKTSRRRGKSLF